ENLSKVDEVAERKNLEAAVKDLRQVEITYLEDASLRSLRAILQAQDFDVFHYIGHSDFNPETGAGVLALEDPYEHKTAIPISGEALARELYDERGIRLVVLNSCEGARQDVRDPFSGIASSLVQRGIPAVVAQQFEISDRAAIEFSKAFYEALARGSTIEAAVLQGRRAIAANTLNNTEWVSPVLFLHDHDTRSIFEFSRRPTEKQRNRLYQVTTGVSILIALAFLAVIFSLSRRGDDVEAVAPATATPLPLVDLVMTNISVEPRNPQPGREAAVLVEIENRGSDPAPFFTYEWQPSIFSSQKISRRVEGLAPGGILRESLPVRFGWWGTFISEGRVDVNNEIIEISEQNNKLNPVRTNTRMPFDIHFDEPLPDGTTIQQNMPLPPDTFAAWGFQVSAESDDPACVNVVPWLKFVGISWVALGTGLPDNPEQCAESDLLITFLERQDNNLSGISALTITATPDEGSYTVETFQQSGELLETITGTNNTMEGISLITTPDITRFSRIFSVRIHPEDSPILITDLSLFA
ncbi:MAG: CHAT domain-containing protein, partial [Anaerolineae bacterium]|nr:CHAT domain-containing protein [Anaerolineae bacterium]